MGDASMTRTANFRSGGQVVRGPKGDLDQSIARMVETAIPPPAHILSLSRSGFDATPGLRMRVSECSISISRIAGDEARIDSFGKEFDVFSKPAPRHSRDQIES